MSATSSRIAALVGLLALAACDTGPQQQPFDIYIEPDVDAADAGPDVPADIADTGDTADAADTGDGSGDADVAIDEGPEIPVYDGIPSFIEMTLAPPRAIYAPAQAITLTALAYSEEGEAMPEVELVWSVDPEAAVTPGAEPGAYTLESEGTVTFTACVRYPPPGRRAACGRRAILVDGGVPQVELLRPQPGELLLDEGDQLIRVAGTATDTSGNLQVFVNGDRVRLGRDGSFTAQVPAAFGVNHIDVVATDGLQTREGRQSLDVIWAPEYLAVATDGSGVTSASIDNALRLEMRQGFLDDGIPLDIPPEATLVTADDLASVIELVLGEVDLMPVIPDPVTASDDLTLRVTAADIGPAVVELRITDGGIDLFVGLSGIAVDTEGELNLGGTLLDLDGGFDAAIAASIELRITKATRADPLSVELGGVRLALEGASGRFVSPEANAVLDVVEGLLFRAVEGFLVDAVEEAFVAEVPALIEGALGSIDDLLSNVVLPLDLGFGTPTELVINGALATIVTERQRKIEAILDLGFGARGEPAFPEAPGIPLEQPLDTEPEPFTTGRAAVIVPTAVINGILYSVWNAGLLNLDVSDQIPEALAFLVDSVSIEGRLPPVVTAPDPDRAEYDLIISVGQLEATLGRGEQRDVIGLNLSAGLRVVVEDYTLRVELQEEPDVNAWIISFGGPIPIFDDPAALEPIIRTALWAELTGALTSEVELPLPALAFDAAADFAPRLDDLVLQVEIDRGIELREGFVYIYGGLEGQADLSD
jgi:hypothetical protein